jgi:hypothetical protein
VDIDVKDQGEKTLEKYSQGWMNLAESPNKSYGSKKAVLPMVMWYHRDFLCSLASSSVTSDNVLK